MKNILTILTILVISVSAMAQSKIGIRPYGWQEPGTVHAQSLNINTSSDSLSVLYLHDGYNSSYVATAYPVFQVIGLGNRVTIEALGAYQTGTTKTNLYTGAGFGVSVLRTSGFNFKVYAGLRGVDVTALANTTLNWKSTVFGAEIVIPVSKN